MKELTNELGQPVGPPVATALPCPPPSREPMRGRHCSVVPLDADAHGGQLYRVDGLDTDGGSWTYMPYGPFATEKDYLQWIRSDCAGDDPLFHAILDTDGSPLGVASYLRIQPAAGSIEVGHIHYSPRLQRTAAATEAMFLMMRRVFDELGYRRYEWKCDALNAPSRAAALRLGFTFEGIFRQATVYKGRNRDTAWYAIIDSDWPAIRDAFERWLDPANFDSEGNQLQSLQARR